MKYKELVEKLNSLDVKEDNEEYVVLTLTKPSHKEFIESFTEEFEGSPIVVTPRHQTRRVNDKLVIPGLPRINVLKGDFDSVQLVSIQAA